MSHSPFARNWQTTSVTRFPSNTCGTSDIRISRNSVELHLAPCMLVINYVRGLGPELYIEKKCFVSFSFDSISRADELKEGQL